MTALARRLSTDTCHEVIPPAIARLRVLALTCRAKARLDLHQACAMLSICPEQAAEAYADTLLRSLSDGFGRAPLLHQPGARELSFDEAWINALLSAHLRNSPESAVFLLASRLPRHVRRQIGWLAARLAERLDELG
jgi:hypothetical protein